MDRTVRENEEQTDRQKKSTGFDQIQLNSSFKANLLRTFGFDTEQTTM